MFLFTTNHIRLQKHASDSTRGKHHVLTVKAHVKIRIVARNFVKAWTCPCLPRRTSQISQIEPPWSQTGTKGAQTYAGGMPEMPRDSAATIRQDMVAT